MRVCNAEMERDLDQQTTQVNLASLNMAVSLSGMSFDQPVIHGSSPTQTSGVTMKVALSNEQMLTNDSSSH